jgi:hypothetical protein
MNQNIDKEYLEGLKFERNLFLWSSIILLLTTIIFAVAWYALTRVTGVM